ncbi:hypothetical protein CCR83_08785 [Rhodobacter veldkampii DSM 11550]|uniref:DUF3775 domain-containing protein n=1 Tax=Phaeovulum veldkampii DSM 11550 TaxID=1185920 RepID=A0A2T4JLL1_9RHOB|nr:DUF3775 domain-containing protein [Phaeovulum veldkampii]MBK5946521.1 hypothetical protein [Phaeovulum veldkampii DSM 11550]NCU20035.1 DUF3775 domain-containing protein [Candidatus Falkowbacteria bacterium]PTE18784.1 hypothetical protein C5F46_02595 [Phaeovulum veldkampii DSM 11550]TDQ60000.1 uncharacterized protein DUF3775 [Phaeovulum veldkampii DSM 11550]
MLQISPAKIAHIIVLAREAEADLDAFGTGGGSDARGNSVAGELRAFIAGLNEDEQASLVAVMWVGRETFGPDELDEALETARAEASAPTEDYLSGMPMLADYLEDGLDALGISVEEAEDEVLRLT